MSAFTAIRLCRAPTTMTFAPRSLARSTQPPMVGLPLARSTPSTTITSLRSMSAMEHVALLVRAVRRADEADRVGPVAIADRAQSLGDEAVRLVPAHLHQGTLLPEQWCLQPVGRARHLVDVPSADADPAPVGGVRHAWIGADDPVARRLQVDPATDAAEAARGQRVGHSRSFPIKYVCAASGTRGVSIGTHARHVPRLAEGQIPYRERRVPGSAETEQRS